MTPSADPSSTAAGRRARRRVDPPASPLPQRLGAWELVRLVGEGRLARVYQARPAAGLPGQNACYAIKVLREEWREDPRAEALLRREAQVGRAVSHPHLISVLAAQVQEPPQHVVMPYLEGATLSDRLAAGPLSVPYALWIVRQVAEALGALHAAGWVHADVKPSNIFVAPSGHATLLDLGFARPHDEGASVLDRPVLGTIQYIAPELLTSALRADIRSDLYSLGVTLFELLTERLPFEGDDLGELATRHRQESPIDLRSLVPHVPREVAQLVRQMLAKEPLRRPQTPRELIRRLVALEIDTLPQQIPA